ncbi:AAA family ATPase [Halovivax limisalsi]|uniref:AAA family ATPase n=1 Tax=Halovivax limisalsi TaxID=1453760 RepID=UPI001FFCC51A|nr:MoxR family ATPase [Halovivax limisalsi]
MTTTPSDAATTCERVLDAVGDAVIADRDFLETVLVGVLARGHVLLEDVPGTGKTLTADALASALDLSFSRIQFTPDLLPADVTGTHVYDEREATFEFTEGPIFANVVLADEINRAPPKTQAALLEAMSERQVTVAGETMALPDPFVVIATQNPVESEGTFPLPEAQVDRFAVKTSIGYPGREGEATLLRERTARTSKRPSVDPVLESVEAVRSLQAAPESVRVSDDLIDYMTAIAAATRRAGRVRVGVSPRGTQRLLEVSRATAVLEGRDYLAPADVKSVAPAVLAHRLVLTPEASVEDVSKRAVLERALESVPVPTVSRGEAPAPE